AHHFRKTRNRRESGLHPVRLETFYPFDCHVSLPGGQPTCITLRLLQPYCAFVLLVVVGPEHARAEAQGGVPIIAVFIEDDIVIIGELLRRQAERMTRSLPGLVS